MQRSKVVLFVFLAILSLTISKNSAKAFDNHTLMSSVTPGLSQAEFERVIREVGVAMTPRIAAHQKTLSIYMLWKNDTPNAGSNQSVLTPDTWSVFMFGGLARRPEMTPDAFEMVMCHEMGHHLGGYPFYNGWIFKGWGASEGQSDYFASQVCLRKTWRAQIVENARFRFNVDPHVKFKCDQVWSREDDQNLCYRIAAAGKVSVHILYNLIKEKKNEKFNIPDDKSFSSMTDPGLLELNGGGSSIADPAFGTPDKTSVGATERSYPSIQCRLDTYLAGALCPVEFDLSIIPGRAPHPLFTDIYQNSMKAEAIAAKYSCTSKQHPLGARPACWYHSRM